MEKGLDDHPWKGMEPINEGPDQENVFSLQGVGRLGLAKDPTHKRRVVLNEDEFRTRDVPGRAVAREFR